MPRRLPESTKEQEKLPRKFRGKRRPYIATFEQEARARQELEVLIDDFGSRGDGTARIQGFLIFVPKTKVGERLKAKIVKVGRGFALAEKVKETGGEN